MATDNRKAPLPPVPTTGITEREGAWPLVIASTRAKIDHVLINGFYRAVQRGNFSQNALSPPQRGSVHELLEVELPKWVEGRKNTTFVSLRGDGNYRKARLVIEYAVDSGKYDVTIPTVEERPSGEKEKEAKGSGADSDEGSEYNSDDSDDEDESGSGDMEDDSQSPKYDAAGNLIEMDDDGYDKEHPPSSSDDGSDVSEEDGAVNAYSPLFGSLTVKAIKEETEDEGDEVVATYDLLPSVLGACDMYLRKKGYSRKEVRSGVVKLAKVFSNEYRSVEEPTIPLQIDSVRNVLLAHSNHVRKGEDYEFPGAESPPQAVPERLGDASFPNVVGFQYASVYAYVKEKDSTPYLCTKDEVLVRNPRCLTDLHYHLLLSDPRAQTFVQEVVGKPVNKENDFWDPPLYYPVKSWLTLLRECGQKNKVITTGDLRDSKDELIDLNVGMLRLLPVFEKMQGRSADNTQRTGSSYFGKDGEEVDVEEEGEAQRPHGTAGLSYLGGEPEGHLRASSYKAGEQHYTFTSPQRTREKDTVKPLRGHGLADFSNTRVWSTPKRFDDTLNVYRGVVTSSREVFVDANVGLRIAKTERVKKWEVDNVTDVAVGYETSISLVGTEAVKIAMACVFASPRFMSNFVFDRKTYPYGAALTFDKSVRIRESMRAVMNGLFDERTMSSAYEVLGVGFLLLASDYYFKDASRVTRNATKHLGSGFVSSHVSDILQVLDLVAAVSAITIRMKFVRHDGEEKYDFLGLPPEGARAARELALITFENESIRVDMPGLRGLPTPSTPLDNLLTNYTFTGERVYGPERVFDRVIFLDMCRDAMRARDSSSTAPILHYINVRRRPR